MVDKVKPLKFENPASGGSETDVFPTESDPSEDHLSAKGIAFEGLDTVKIYKDGNDLLFVDLVKTTPLSLLQLRFHEAWQYAQEISETNTNSEVTYSTKITMTTPSIAAGDYLVSWSAKFRCNTANRAADFEVRRNSTSFQNGVAFFSSTLATANYAGAEVITLSAGVHTFDLRFKANTTGSTPTVYCSNALIYLMRVA